MDFVSSKILMLLAAAKKENIITVFDSEIKHAAYSESGVSEKVHVSYSTSDGRHRVHESSLGGAVDTKPLESEARVVLSSIMHDLKAHGADWLPDCFKEDVPEETPAS